MTEKLERKAWMWHQAPVKTQWGHDMVVADLAIDKDHTVSIYCEKDQTAKVEVMFTPPAAPVQEHEPENEPFVSLASVQSAERVEPVAQSLKDAVFTVLEGFTLPHEVRKILETAYYTTPPEGETA